MQRFQGLWGTPEKTCFFSSSHPHQPWEVSRTVRVPFHREDLSPRSCVQRWQSWTWTWVQAQRNSSPYYLRALCSGTVDRWESFLQLLWAWRKVEPRIEMEELCEDEVGNHHGKVISGPWWCPTDNFCWVMSHYFVRGWCQHIHILNG